MVEDALHEVLGDPVPQRLVRIRPLMRMLKRAYAVDGPPMLAQSMMDRLSHDGRHAFHIGTGAPTMRRIASWVLSLDPNQPDRLEEVLVHLWRRNGREDVRLVGLILANMDPVRASRSAWATLARIIGPSEPVEVLLEVVEECVRAGHEPPADAALLDLIDGRPITEHLVLLIACVRGSGAGPAVRSIIEAAPAGGDLLERMRDRVLAASD